MRSWRLTAPLLLLAVLCSSCHPQQPASEPTSRRTETFMVPMRDGVKLCTIVAFPEGEGPWPVLLTRTPYNARPAMGDAESITRNGVVRIVQDLRGRFGSVGEDAIFLNDGWGEKQDGYDTIEWIARQPWCNGKVGMIGGSAGGITQYLAAGTGPEALKCCHAVVACASLYHHAAYIGGAFRQHDMDTWMTQNKFSAAAQQQVIANSVYNDLWKTVDLTTRPEQVHAAMIHSGGWYDMFCQGTIDAFVALQHRGGEGARGRQVLEMGPWTHGMRPGGDLQFPPSASEHPVSSKAALWLAHYLLGFADPGIPADKPVFYYTMGACGEPGAPGNEWHNVADWPVPSVPTPLYLHAVAPLPQGEGSGVRGDAGFPHPNPVPRAGGQGTLVASFEVPTAADASLSFNYDPENPVPTLGGGNLTIKSGPADQRSAENRDDVLVFTTAPLEKPLEVTGQVFAKLFVSSDCPDTDFTAKLTDVYPDGRSMLVCDGILRMRFRNGFDKEEMMEPGKVYEVMVDLWSTSIVFNAGHCIRVAISSSNAPRFEPNPNTGAKFRADRAVRVARNTLYCDRAHPSCLILPVPDRGT